MTSLRYDIRFTGRVQGVGFRFITERVASGHVVAGWVRNEPDGSVRCVIEGAVSDLDRFVSDVQQAMVGNLEGTDIAERPANGEFERFSIRH